MLQAAARSSLSGPRITILIASSDNGLQRLGLIPRRAYPDVSLFIGQQEAWP